MKLWHVLRPSVPKAFGLLALLWCLSASAQEPKIRARLQAPDPLWAGEKATLVIELLAPGYFSSAVNFDLPDPGGIILQPPAGRAVVSGETIEGTYYVVQRHELAVYPARSGKFIIPPFHVRFAFKHAPLDHDDIPAIVTTPPLALTVTAPPGTAGLGQVISARDLQVAEEWKPEPGKSAVKAGDAFTRTITFSAPGVPGMIFPPFPAGKIDGLRLYPKPPVLLDHAAAGAEREELHGERRDTIVYVCERPGRFTIPAVRLTWWDIEAKRLRTADLPARLITVIANPALASADTSAAPQADWRDAPWWWIGSGAALIVLIGVGLRSSRLRRAWGYLVTPLRPVHLQPLNPSATRRFRE